MIAICPYLNLLYYINMLDPLSSLNFLVVKVIYSIQNFGLYLLILKNTVSGIRKEFLTKLPRGHSIIGKVKAL